MLKSILKKTPLQQVITKNEKPLGKNVLISVENIKKNYGKEKVLKGISFKIKEGERVSIIGANGAGKSTLTEIISTIKEPTSGEVRYSFGTTKRDISAGIGIQFQKSSYPMFYKVNDIVRFFIDASGKKISNEELDQMYKDFQLYEIKNSYATGLSGGQQQRLNILLAVAHSPRLLLLDELSTGLDVESRTKMKKFVKNYITKTKSTMILVSHNPDEIEFLSNRLIILNGGNVFEDVKVSEIKKKFKNVSDYIDDLFMNRFKKEGSHK